MHVNKGVCGLRWMSVVCWCIQLFLKENKSSKWDWQLDSGEPFVLLNIIWNSTILVKMSCLYDDFSIIGFLLMAIWPLMKFYFYALHDVRKMKLLIIYFLLWFLWYNLGPNSKFMLLNFTSWFYFDEPNTS